MIGNEIFKYKQIIFTLILAAANLAYASDISYDQQNITPQTWEEVDLSYVHTINGKDYTEQANLLRPISWIKQRHLDKIGNTVHLTEGEVGGDINAKVLAIKSTKLNYANNVSGNDKPVISTFIKHSDDVWDYTFKDRQANTETIEATSNHPFYSLDRQDYIPIGQIRIGEHLKAENGSETILLSRLKHNKGVETIYNLEVYQAHNYQVDSNNLLVHNDCGCLDGLCQRIKCWWRREPTPPSTSTIAQNVSNTGNINSGFTAEPGLELSSLSGNSVEFIALDLEQTLWQFNREDNTIRPINEALWNHISKMYKEGAIIKVLTVGGWQKPFVQGVFKDVRRINLELTDIYNSTDGILHGNKGDWLDQNLIKTNEYAASTMSLYDDYNGNLDNALKHRIIFMLFICILNCFIVTIAKAYLSINVCRFLLIV